MPPSLGQYLGPGHPFFHAPSVDLTVHWFGDTTHDWLLTRARSRWAGDGYASAQIDLWDLERKPVATATQVMLVRFPDPEDLRAPATVTR
jgi:acyl-CoA thioesterase